MATNTGIEWTEATWNPMAGCTPVSPGCKNCYAMKMAHRLEGMGQPKYAGTTRKTKSGVVQWSGRINFDSNDIVAPSRWRKPRRVFVNSMSDLFHEETPLPFLGRVFVEMAANPHHQFQILTKRPINARDWLRELGRDFALWPLPNVWIGVSVEDQQRAEERIPILLELPAAVRWISFEPLLGPVDIFKAAAGFLGLHWAVIGGESGPGARACNVGWIRKLRDDLRKAATPVFVKQLGRHPIQQWTTRGGWTETDPIRLRHRKGGNPDEWPEDLRIREFPNLRT